MIIKGKFVSVWDNDVEIETPAELDTETGEVTTINTIDNVEDLDILIREYFVSDDEMVEEEICTSCHTHIIKGIMIDDEFTSCYDEQFSCTNPECEMNLNVTF